MDIQRQVVSLLLVTTAAPSAPSEALRIRVSWDRCPRPNGTSPRDCQWISSGLVLANQGSVSLASANRTEEWRGDRLVRQVSGSSGSTLTLVDPGLEDSGWYRCSVCMEIPSLRCLFGNGTEVVVIVGSINFIRAYHAHSRDVYLCFNFKHVKGAVVPWWVWVVVGAGSVFLVVTLVGIVILCWRCRVRMERESRQNPVYSNTQGLKHSVASSRPLPGPGPGPTPKLKHTSLTRPCPKHPRTPQRPTTSGPKRSLNS
ncbi:hypothetical protein ANANG_G00130110 [Anguilla anguilla]|uniref:Ig-like domain-containing protein n=1 Tax=Anguilla anguilla TaxID=7936 RepID=A0A9D3MGY0_ANGAN|nr:hypothetical protein ANANG_G00130110 [Anguilla anguilla]